MHTCGCFDICFTTIMYIWIYSLLCGAICQSVQPSTPPKNCLDVPKDHENGALTSSGLSLWGLMWRTQTHISRLWQLPPPQFVVSGGQEESKEDQMRRLKEGSVILEITSKPRCAWNIRLDKDKGSHCSCKTQGVLVFEHMLHRTV